MSLKYNGNLIPLAKTLRKNQTKQEKHLWYDFLRDYPIRFQRQKTIAGYIVDFYCHQANLIIEIDGSQHFYEDGIIYDENRSKVLNNYGLEVLRITNIEIDRKFKEVCEYIDMKVKASISEGGGKTKGFDGGSQSNIKRGTI